MMITVGLSEKNRVAALASHLIIVRPKIETVERYAVNLRTSRRTTWRRFSYGLQRAGHILSGMFIQPLGNTLSQISFFPRERQAFAL